MNQSSPHTKIIQRCSSSNMHKIDLLWRRNMIFKAFNLQIREETRKTDSISLCYIPHRSYYSIFPLCSVREEFLLIFFWVIVISTRSRHLKRIIICHKSIIIRFHTIIKTASDENKIHRKGETQREQNKTAIRLMITTRWRLSPVVEFNTQGETSTQRVILYSS